MPIWLALLILALTRGWRVLCSGFCGGSLLLPLQELLKQQRVLLGRCCGYFCGLRRARGEEKIEFALRLLQGLFRMLIEPGLRRGEASPSLQWRTQHDLLPLGVKWRLLELLEFFKEGLNKMFDLSIAVGSRRPVIGGEDCRHCDRIDALAGGDQGRIVFRLQL